MALTRLLLVDDEERFLSTTKSLLERRGIDAFTATNGLDALKTMVAPYTGKIRVDRFDMLVEVAHIRSSVLSGSLPGDKP